MLNRLEYNTLREYMVIPEYGRNIQKMIQHALTIRNKEELDKYCKEVVKVMGLINAQQKHEEDFEHKLWDHLHIISGFQLDIESPFEKPSPQKYIEKPQRLGYPKNKIRFGHYGVTLELLIKKAVEIENQEEKAQLVIIIANLMKRFYLMWNKSNIENYQIAQNLHELSEGKLKVNPDSITEKGEKRKSNNNNKNRNKHKRKKR